jgi:hypothetical protein
MKRFRNLRLPSAAMIIAVIALVMALGGTGFAAKKLLKLGALSDGAKNKTVGVGKLTYVTTTTNATQPNQAVAPALCPSGFDVIGGGIKVSNPAHNTSQVVDSYPTTTGWAGRVFFTAATQTATTTAICAKSRAITGAPPSS